MTIEFSSTTPDGSGYLSIIPFVTADGVPKVVLMVRTDVAEAYKAVLDGHPAIAYFLGEKADGKGDGNAPWELGHLLAQQWEEAKKMAANQAAASKP